MKKQAKIKKEQAVTPARSRDIATSSLTLFVIRVQRYCFFLTYANFASKKSLHLSNYVGQKTSQVLKLGRPGNVLVPVWNYRGRLYRMV